MNFNNTKLLPSILPIEMDWFFDALSSFYTKTRNQLPISGNKKTLYAPVK